jgi:REP element-mobilizing transposase RayT
MMNKPLVIAHHLIWTAYGYWLPNDPQGSTSKHIASNILAELGKLHYGRKKIQPAGKVIREFQNQAAEVLKYSFLEFGSPETTAIAESFTEVISTHRYTCYACAIMPDHIHLLIRKHRHLAEEMIGHFQEESRLRLRKERLRSPDHPVWGGPGWKVFLDHPNEIREIIHYIQENPVKYRLPPQHWPFVVKYDGWPLHPGHSPNSPYAKRLRNYKFS